MPNTGSLADLGQRLSLSGAELDWLRTSGVRSADGMHNLLTADVTGSDVPPPILDVGRRRGVVAALAPLLSDAYRKGLARRIKCPRGAAVPSAAALTTAREVIPPEQIRAGLQGLPAIDLVEGRYANWPILHDQGDRQACVAFAVTACLELLRAGQGTSFVPLSPQYLYWHMRTSAWPQPQPPGWEDGATKLTYAKQVLATRGFCSWQACPYITDLPPLQSLEGPEPSDVAKAEGQANLVTHGRYRPQQVPGIAREVYDLLGQGRPVAIAVPVYARTGGSSVTNWSSGITSGEVLDPYPDSYREFAGGHAVCVVAFQPDPAERGGGWFIFRNSVGLNWAYGLPGDDPPQVPERGYGALSATYVEGYCWELFSPTLA
jgi:hypothetical protein